MPKPLLEKRRVELDRELPYFKDKSDLLVRALRHMAKVHPERAEKIKAFKMFYGLNNPPMTLAEIGVNLGCTGSNVGVMRRVICKNLMHPNWRSEERWPQPSVRAALSRMTEDRVAEIAVQMQEWRYRGVGTRVYMGELQQAADDLKIGQEEMLEFYKAIADRLMKRV